MKRSGYLKRKARLRPKRFKPRRSGRGAQDIAYRARVSDLPCLVCLIVPAGDADHAGRRPLGRKCSDYECIPLCRLHHMHRTDYSGIFRGWTGAQMRAWCDRAITWTQKRLGYQRFEQRRAA